MRQPSLARGAAKIPRCWHEDCERVERSVRHIRLERWVETMSQRQTNLLWLKDLLEHLAECQQQLEWAEDGEAIEVLTETMIRDLDCCRRLCDTLRRKARLQYAV